MLSVGEAHGLDSMNPMTMRDTLKRLAVSAWLAPLLCGLAMLFVAPSVNTGLQLDDFFHKVMLEHQSRFPTLQGRGPWDMFAFVPGDRPYVERCIRDGILPWWSAPDLRLSFFRPVSSFTHWLDYTLWPDRPALMHLHSMAWLAALVAGVTSLYRRVHGVGSLAGLAALMYAVDEAHGLPAGWVANRNALIAAFLGTMTILAYVRWRQGSHLGGVFAPIALLMALGSSEAALGVPAYLFAYAMFLDTGPWIRRLIRLAPCAAATLAWIVLYKHLGYGATGSGMYIDPAAEPVAFAAAVVRNGPLLMLGQLALPPADVWGLLGGDMRPWYWGAALIVSALLLARIMVGSRDGGAREGRASHRRAVGFWAVGMILSMLPCCGTAPSNRLLLLSGLGAMPLLAAFMLSIKERFASAGPRSVALCFDRHLVRTLVPLHLVLSPLAVPILATGAATFGDVIEPIADSMPDDSEISSQDLMIVHAPTTFLFHYANLLNFVSGRPVPARTFVLGSGLSSGTLTREDDRTIRVSLRGGWLRHDSRIEDDHPTAPADMRHLWQTFDILFRSPGETFKAGDRFKLADAEGEVTHITPDGRPLEIKLRFAKSLDDHRRWMLYRDRRLEPFRLPEVGASVDLPEER